MRLKETAASMGKVLQVSDHESEAPPCMLPDCPLSPASAIDLEIDEDDGVHIEKAGTSDVCREVLIAAEAAARAGIVDSTAHKKERIQKRVRMRFKKAGATAAAPKSTRKRPATASAKALNMKPAAAAMLILDVDMPGTAAATTKALKRRPAAAPAAASSDVPACADEWKKWDPANELGQTCKVVHRNERGCVFCQLQATDKSSIVQISDKHFKDPKYIVSQMKTMWESGYSKQQCKDMKQIYRDLAM